MSCERVVRPELVGKRFLCVGGPPVSSGSSSESDTPTTGREEEEAEVDRATLAAERKKMIRNGMRDWHWRAGIIRAASSPHDQDRNLQILVEYEDHHWDKREWVRVFKDNFHVFLIEHNMVLAQRPPGPRNIHPAFTFKTLVDNVNMATKSRNQPVEFLVDGKLDFQVYDKLKIIWEWDASIPNLFLGQNIEDKVREWTDFRDTQHLLINLPAALVGARLKVYRAEGTTQWFDAIMQKYKTDTTEFVMIDDRVLQEHTEDPRLLQMGFLNRQDLESYQKGQSPGSSNRKSRSSTQRLSLQSMLPSSNLSASMLRKSQSSSSLSTPYSSKKRSSRSSTIQSTPVFSPSEAHSPFHSPKDEEEEEDTPLALRKKLKPKRRSEPITSTATNPPTSLSLSSAKSTTTLPETTTSQELDQNEPTKKVRGRPKGAKTKARGQDKKPDHRTRLRSLSSSESGGSSISASSLSSPPETKFKAPTSAGVARKSSQPSSTSKKSSKSLPASPNKRLRRAVSASGPPSKDQIKPVHVNQDQSKSETNNSSLEESDTDSESTPSPNDDGGNKSVTKDDLQKLRLARPLTKKIKPKLNTSSSSPSSSSKNRVSPRFSDDQEQQPAPLSSNILERAPTEETSPLGNQKPLAIVRPQRKEAATEEPRNTETSRSEAEIGESEKKSFRVTLSQSPKGKALCKDKRDISLYDFDDEAPASPVTTTRFNKAKPATTSLGAKASAAICSKSQLARGITNVDSSPSGKVKRPASSCGTTAKGSSLKTNRSQSVGSNHSSKSCKTPPSASTSSARAKSSSESRTRASSDLPPATATRSTSKHRDEDKMDCDMATPSNVISSLGVSSKCSGGHLDLESDSGVSTFRSDGARSSGDERSGSRSSALSDEHQQRALSRPSANTTPAASDGHITPGSRASSASGWRDTSPLDASSTSVRSHLIGHSAAELLAAAAASAPENRPISSMGDHPSSSRGGSHPRASLPLGAGNLNHYLNSHQQLQHNAVIAAYHYQLQQAQQQYIGHLAQADPAAAMSLYEREKERERKENERLRRQQQEEQERVVKEHRIQLEQQARAQQQQQQQREERERQEREILDQKLAAEAVEQHFVKSMEMAKKFTQHQQQQQQQQHHHHLNHHHQQQPQQVANHFKNSSKSSNSSSNGSSGGAGGGSVGVPQGGSHGPGMINPRYGAYQHQKMSGNPPQSPWMPGLGKQGVPNGASPVAYQHMEERKRLMEEYERRRQEDYLRTVHERAVAAAGSSVATAAAQLASSHSSDRGSTGHRGYSKQVKQEALSGPPLGLHREMGQHPAMSLHSPYSHHGSLAQMKGGYPPRTVAGPVGVPLHGGGLYKHPLEHAYPGFPPSHSPGGNHPPHSASQEAPRSSPHRNHVSAHPGYVPKTSPAPYPVAFSAPPSHARNAVSPAGQSHSGKSSSSGRPPSRPESLPAKSMSTLPQPPALRSQPLHHLKEEPLPSTNSKPPPAHGGSARSSLIEPAPPSDQPLDLGAPKKRSLASEVCSEPSEDLSVPPKKVQKTVPKTEPEELTNGGTTAPTTTPVPDSNGDDSNSSFSRDYYVHKLKKAWIAAYEGSNDGGPNSSGTTTPQPATARATPSPALSQVSSTSSMPQRGRKPVKSASGLPLANGHAVSPSLPKKSRDSSSSSETDDNSNASGKGSRRGKKKSWMKNGSSKSDATKKSNQNESFSESEKDLSDEGKDSDSTTATHSSRKSNKTNEPAKKRGRKPKNRDRDEPKAKLRSINPFHRPSTATLKKTGERFLQDASCYQVAPKLAKCRECRWTQSQRNKKMPNIFCRFYAFRRLKYSKKTALLSVAGFCDPKDAREEDLDIWRASWDNAPEKLTVQQANYLISHLRADFELLIRQEEEAKNVNTSVEKDVAWKRVVQGVREMCDVCDATLFNYHWACCKCGFVVCLDCYRGRKNKENLRSWGGNEKDRDEFSWLLCTNSSCHDLEKLIFVQIIAGNALDEVSRKLIASSSRTAAIENGKNFEEIKEEDFANGDDLKANGGSELAMQDIISKAVEKSMKENGNGAQNGQPKELKYFSLPSEKNSKSRWRNQEVESITWHKVTDSKLFHSEVDHSWMDHGRVLRLESKVEDAFTLDMFQEMWKHGSPVVISKSIANMNKSLWCPKYFLAEHSDNEAAVINLTSGKVQTMPDLAKFWTGFSDHSKRSSETSILKLQDWPPMGDEFMEALPEHTSDLMKHLPLTSYTGRHAMLNTAASLPDVFVRSDLGPRPCFTYGFGTNPDHESKGTVELHFELADSLNILLNVSTAFQTTTQNVVQLLQRMDVLDDESQNRIVEKNELLGAIWHVYHPADADKIRDFLNRERHSKETGKKKGHFDSSFDPIYEGDQYLCARRRKTLAEDYNVVPCTILQFLGDAVFIPAGSPCQARHIHNSMSISLDFVSPENLSHTFQLFRDLRKLPESQPVAEDKLQVKNLIFHSIKNALSVLEASEKTKVKKEEIKKI